MNETLPPHAPLELKSERVQRDLTQLTHWTPTQDHQGIELSLTFSNPISLYAYIEAFAKLAGREMLRGGQLVFFGGAVVVTLRHAETFQGVTPAQLDFARLLSQRKETQAGSRLLERETTE